MRDPGEETAEAMRDPSIWTKAHEAARVYSFLKIKCPGCRVSILGSDFANHVIADHPEVVT